MPPPPAPSQPSRVTPMAGAVAALDEAARAVLCRDVTVALHAYVDDDGLAAPMECHVATAHV